MTRTKRKAKARPKFSALATESPLGRRLRALEERLGLVDDGRPRIVIVMLAMPGNVSAHWHASFFGGSPKEQAAELKRLRGLAQYQRPMPPPGHDAEVQARQDAAMETRPEGPALGPPTATAVKVHLATLATLEALAFRNPN